ncbi:Pregnancy zone protein [Blattella germanica]|nr:Pregnancy zone protein [Blattella germanica]
MGPTGFRYTYGQPVNGQLHIKAVPLTPTWRQRKTKPPEINLMTEMQSSDGCYTFNISGTELGLHDWDVAPNSIVLSAFMTEAGTENTQNATAISSVIHQALKLEFLPHSSQYFKPGLPYKGKATAVGYQTKYYSPDKRWRVFMDQPSAFFDVHTWFSPTDSYIEIADKNEKTLKCDSHHKFDVFFTTQPNVSHLTFHYLVKSRGDLIHFGQLYHHTQNQSLRLDEGFHNILGGNDDVDRNSTSGEAESEDETNAEKKVEKVVLNIKILPKMSPLSYILVYYVREDGETVAATHTIKISAAPNSLCALTAVDKSTSLLSKHSSKVDMDRVFQDLSRFPIEVNSGPIQSDPWEYCVKSQENSTSTAGSNEDDRQASHGVLVDPPEPAFWDLRRRRRKRFIATQPPSKYVDSIQAFDDFGVVVMSDLTLETRPCNSVIDSAPAHGLKLPSMSPLAFPLTVQSASYPKSYVADSRPSAVEVRSFFPETWLWELQYVGESGEAHIKREVPHTITEWISSTMCISSHLGLGVAPPSQLTAFQPFFLDYSMPYSIKRGEVVQLKVSLFNFLSHSLPVRITLEDSSGVELLDNSSSVAICVSERTSYVQRFRIRASDLGEVNMTISAEVDPLYPEECGPEVMINRRDVLVKPILVHPEGFPVEITKSAFICPSNFSEDAQVMWSLELPSDVVEDSARADVSVVGDLLGPTLQNMILFVPNLHVINYLNSTQQVNPVLKSEAIKNMQKGYQRELNYRHSDGSYSAFGDSDDEGSMWLTAFVLKSFSQARGHIFVDEDELKTSMRWIIKKQLENGCFPVVGKVFHKDMKGGLTGETSSAALTAYVLISLLESGFPLSPTVTYNAMFCLRGEADPDVYTLALTTYAFTLLGEQEMAQESIKRLLGKATKQQDLIWWEKQGTTSLGLSVEMTAYAVLSLVKIGGEENLISALQADTVVALEALAKYAITLPRSENGLSITITAIDMLHTFPIQEQDRLLLKKQNLPLLPTPVEVVGAGEGCALVQTSLRYNVRNASGSDAFELEVRTGPVASVDECTMQRLEACVRFKIPDQSSNMAVLEVYMVSGYIPDRASLYQLTHQPDINVKRWEEEKDKVNFYFEELTTRRQCINFLLVQETEVENPSPAVVKVYDYYQQEFSVQTKYNTDGGCRNEKLPHPQPDISNENTIVTNPVFSEAVVMSLAPVDLQMVLPNINELPISMMQADTSTMNSVNETEGLNPQFVNVDHELETPSGEEGPVPTYVLPPADVGFNVTSNPESNKTSDSLPQADKDPNEEGTVYKLSTRKGSNARLLINMSPGQTAHRVRKLVKLEMSSLCICKPLEKEGIDMKLPTGLPNLKKKKNLKHVKTVNNIDKREVDCIVCITLMQTSQESLFILY